MQSQNQVAVTTVYNFQPVKTFVLLATNGQCIRLLIFRANVLLCSCLTIYRPTVFGRQMKSDFGVTNKSDCLYRASKISLTSLTLLIWRQAVHLYRAMLCIRGTSHGPVSVRLSVCPSVCLSVRLSVTSRCSTKTAKRRITQTTPHDTPGTLVF